MTRADHPSGTDRIAEVAATLDAEIIVNVQGDEPLIAPETIMAALHPVQSEPDLPIATTCEPLEPSDVENPNVVKVVCDAQGNALYFSRAPIPYPRRLDIAQTLWRKHTGLYVYRRQALLHLTALPPAPLELARRAGATPGADPRTNDSRCGDDTPRHQRGHPRGCHACPPVAS